MSQADRFANRPVQLESPIEGGAAVSGDDDNDLATHSRAILVEVSGDVKIQYVNEDIDTVPLAAQVWHPMRVRKIFATGTTATGIHVGY